jgi:methylglutaconyl-CoA hydratase
VSTLELRREGAAVTVALNRPGVRNAFNAEMIEALTSTFDDLAQRQDVRVVVLAGNGRTFSAGADVHWMRASLDFTDEENLADARRMSDMFAAIDHLPQPLICRVHGAALGGGVGLVAVSDIVLAEEGAQFGFTEVKLGIIPAVISRFVVPKIGTSWARALYLTGERFGADVAQRIGLVHHVVPTDRLDDLVRQKVHEVQTSGQIAVREAKALIADVVTVERESVRDLTVRRIATLRASAEGQEGLRAFLDKRSPSWIEGT